MLARKSNQRLGDVFGLDDLDKELRKYFPDEIVDLIDEVTVEVEDDPDDDDRGRRGRRTTGGEPPKFGFISTGNEVVYWMVGRHRHRRGTKKLVAVGGLLVTAVGVVYRYIQEHGDQIASFLQTVLQGG